MSKQLEGKSCQICHSYLFEDDDIVYCPECGAPYHRDCYNSVGKCVLEEFHGTSLQYDKVQKEKAEQEKRGEETKKTRVCPHCKRETTHDGDFCPYCGKSMSGSTENGASHFAGGFSPYGFMAFDMYGGVPKETIIEDEVTAEEAAAYIGPKASRYLPNFVNNKKVNWNWAAFLCPPAWFGYRKCYFQAAVTFAIMLVSFICLVPMYSEMLALIGNLPELTANPTPQEAYALAEQLVASAPLPTLLLFYLSSLLSLASSVLSGLFGERWYRARVLEGVKKVKAEHDGEDKLKTLAAKGGINFFLFVIILLINANSSTVIGLICSFFQ